MGNPSKPHPMERYRRKIFKLFVANNGRPAIPVRIALGALTIKEKKNLSDEELVEDIRESPYLQYFLGYEGYKYEILFDLSMKIGTKLRKRVRLRS